MQKLNWSPNLNKHFRIKPETTRRNEILFFTTDDIDECSAIPCENGGTCSNDVGSFTCTCAGTGFIGPTCSGEVDFASYLISHAVTPKTIYLFKVI